MAYVIPCVRFNRAVSPSLGLQVSFRISVGDAVSSAIFNGLANTTATLGSFYWLGFETSGLSPDKKRLALLGAQRQSDVTACRQRAPTSGLRFECSFGFRLGAGRQLIIRVLFGDCFFRGIG